MCTVLVLSTKFNHGILHAVFSLCRECNGLNPVNLTTSTLTDGELMNMSKCFFMSLSLRS